MDLTELSTLLQCPDCGGGLVFEAVPQYGPEAGTCGLLHCSCFTYPVFDGIPIVTKERLTHRSIADDREVAGGPMPEDLEALVKAGNALDGLVDLLTFPVCPWPLNKIGALRRLSLREPHHRLGLAYRRRLVRRMLKCRDRLTAEDWMAAFYWHAPAPFDPFNYFFFRFGQPRHLATLAMLSVFPRYEAPLLDLACGYGHFLFSVTNWGQRAVGIDQNFHQVWVARHYVAPQALFVCGDANRKLPFQDGVFSAAYCADALQHLHDKETIMAELGRCVGQGPILLTSVINRLVEPADGEPLTPDEYAKLLSERSWRVLTEDELLARYRDGLGPNLHTSSEPQAIAASKWLYYLAATNDTLFRDHGLLGEWLHAAGRIEINPIYSVNGQSLTFQFPSPWYETENRAIKEYMPASASLQNDPDALLAQGVLIGLPEQYSRAAGRPWLVAANRRLLALFHHLNTS